MDNTVERFIVDCFDFLTVNKRLTSCIRPQGSRSENNSDEASVVTSPTDDNKTRALYFRTPITILQKHHEASRPSKEKRIGTREVNNAHLSYVCKQEHRMLFPAREQNEEGSNGDKKETPETFEAEKSSQEIAKRTRSRELKPRQRADTTTADVLTVTCRIVSNRGSAGTKYLPNY